LLKGWTFEIVASDLNERSLDHAKQGTYGDYAIRNLTPSIKQKYFTAVNDRLQVNSALKSLVTFSRLNLQDDARMLFMKGIDVIFCCNVLIYFDVASKRRVIQHFYANLLSHGYLFLGHSESLYGVNEDFRLVHMPSATAYVRGEVRHVPGGTS
jgi:chemotaxis protein methyltransferase CheR